MKTVYIDPDAWQPNQRVRLSKPEPTTLRVERDQPRSTPGIITSIEVTRGVRYVFEVDVVANCQLKFYLANGERKPLHVEDAQIPERSTEKIRITFVAEETGSIWVGILMRKPAVASNVRNNAFFELKSASMQTHQSASEVVASLATMPSRITSLPATLASIIDQVDHVFVHLNEFEEVPNFLKRPEITVTKSQQFGNLRDSGKFLGLREISDEALFFTIDDDIIYPSNYIEKMTSALDRFDRLAAVGVHGIIFPHKPRSFFDRLSVHFRSSLAVDIPVSGLGTGTTACRAGTLRPAVEEFKQHGMADLYFAGIAKNAGVPLISIARRSEWLYDALDPGEQENTLYKETRNNNTPHNSVLRSYGPWGFAEIEKCIEEVKSKTGRDPLAKEARAFLDYGLWVEGGCSSAKVDVPLTKNTMNLANTLNLPGFLREAMFSAGGEYV